MLEKLITAASNGSWSKPVNLTSKALPCAVCCVPCVVAAAAALQPPKPEGWESRYLSDSWSLRSQLFRLAGHAWASGFTPGTLIRALGPWGPGLVDKYVNGRFSVHGERGRWCCVCDRECGCVSE